MERNEIVEVKDSSKMVYRPTQNLFVVKRNGVVLATGIPWSEIERELRKIARLEMVGRSN